MREAKYWNPIEQQRVACTLCPRGCEVADRERGYCGVRENVGGRYVTLVYGRAVAANVDPIEKKPLFHFLPGTTAFSIATAGCNMECKFCQNWDISQFRPEQIRSTDLFPTDVAAAARGRSCASIAYTYSEPVIFYEYMLDSAIEGHRLGVRSVMISNGYILKEPLLELLPRLDAVKVDLKAFTDTFYQKLCAGKLQPVLDSLRWIKEQGTWLEIVDLILPTQNDGEGEILALSEWIVDELGPDVPVHFSQFHPTYRIRNLPRTPVSTLERCYRIAKNAGLNFVYLGNVPGLGYENTLCPGCGTTLIRRVGFTVLSNTLKEGACPSCGRAIPGVWS
ncbi:AmmeMemoRadiSam system radical SAM enzyme [Candidatus Fermentibacteria bacterium]|nr:AmmeMemoRadiSam system radical SAM enzyme [Candidatus Fermentibacteria bacterium]